MSKPSIEITALGKAYKMFNNSSDKVRHALGFGRWGSDKRDLYREFWALRDLNLRIEKGERVGIIGRNGAGKSTLLKIIAGNISPTEGSVVVNGKVHALMELGTGFHPEFTGRENIRTALSYHGFSDAEIRDREEEIIDFSELEDFINQPVKTYSSGMYARLAFSTSTSMRPEILIIDEVLGAGDAYFAGKCLDRMKNLTNQDGVTVLFVSHDISSVQRLCDRAVWIDRGVMLEDGDTVEVSKSYYRSIQQEEALRRMAKARGLRKTRNIPSLKDQIENRVLFHFITPSGAPRHQHKIRKIEIRKDGLPVTQLVVGGPMDNQDGSPNRVVDMPGYMNWSKANRDSQGLFRFFEDRRGSYLHAPFELTFGISQASPSDFEILVNGEFNPAEEVCLEIYWNNRYHPIAKIRGGKGDLVFPIPELEDPEEANTEQAQVPTAQESIKIEADSPPTEPQKEDAPSAIEVAPPSAQPEAPKSNNASIVSWERPDPRIEGVRFLDEAGNETWGVEELSDLIIEISYYSSKPIKEPAFSMSIFQANGTYLCHASTAMGGLNIEEINGYGSVIIRFPQFCATVGEYMMGCSIFHYLDPIQYNGMPPYYDQHDRAYRFKVWKKLDNNLNLGCVRLPFTVEHVAKGAPEQV
jgi:lipopolysaccharide transport system ATP-binding protein